MFTCAGLNDIYEVLGKFSNAVQKPNIPPWEVSSIVETYTNALEKMSDNITPSRISTDSLNKSLFPTFSDVVNQVSERGEFENCPILHKKIAVHSTRRRNHAEEFNCEEYSEALQVASKTLHSFSSNLVANLKLRFSNEQEKHNILHRAGNIFDVKKILKRENIDDVKSDLNEYVKMAKSSGNLDSEVSIKDIVQEYKTFAERVKEIAPQYLYVHKEKEKPNKPDVQIEYPERYLQQELYSKLLETPQLYKDIGNVLHLSLTAMCRTHCEAVVEGMGSVITHEMRERGRLDFKTIEREALIRWQGPHPSTKSSTELIKNSLDLHFRGRANWHFCSKDDRAKYFTVGEVQTRIKKCAEENEKISFF